MIYIDTHVAVWLYSGDIQLISKDARKIIEDHQILISPMVLLEMDFLYEIKRIRAGAETIRACLEQQIGLAVCNKPFELICKNAAFHQWTRDPFDRVITAQAAITNTILVTKDHTIRKHYAQAIW